MNTIITILFLIILQKLNILIQITSLWPANLLDFLTTVLIEFLLRSPLLIMPPLFSWHSLFFLYNVWWLLSSVSNSNFSPSPFLQERDVCRSVPKVALLLCHPSVAVTFLGMFQYTGESRLTRTALKYVINQVRWRAVQSWDWPIALLPARTYRLASTGYWNTAFEDQHWQRNVFCSTCSCVVTLVLIL